MSKRVAWEQSRLMDVVTWARGVDTVEELQPLFLFNVSLNLLFHKSGEESTIAKESEELLKPLSIGVPTDFAPNKRIDGETAVQNIDTKYSAKRNLFVDVGEGDNDCVDFGVKVDKVLMGEVEVKSFVDGVVEEIRKAVADGE